MFQLQHRCSVVQLPCTAQMGCTTICCILSQIKSVTGGRIEVIIYQQSLTAMNNVRELCRSWKACKYENHMSDAVSDAGSSATFGLHT